MPDWIEKLLAEGMMWFIIVAGVLVLDAVYNWLT